MRRYLKRLSGYSRAQITCLTARWMASKPMHKVYKASVHVFGRCFTLADIDLLPTVDREMDGQSWPAPTCVLRRQYEVFGDARFERLAGISPAHIYNLRDSGRYRDHRVKRTTKKRPTKASTIGGGRKTPAPDGRPPGFIHIDNAHQGDQDRAKGLYHINAAGCVTQWQMVATVQTITEAFMLPVIEQMLEQFPFEVLGFHADSGNEYVNQQVSRMLEKLLRIALTRSRPQHSNDNALVEPKNGVVILKLFGYEHIPQYHAAQFNAFCLEYLNPFLNFHRSYLFVTSVPDFVKLGRIKHVYRAKDTMAPSDKLARPPDSANFLRPSITFEEPVRTGPRAPRPRRNSTKRAPRCSDRSEPVSPLHVSASTSVFTLTRRFTACSTPTETNTDFPPATPSFNN